MKIFHSSINTSPFRMSVTVMDENNNLNQIAFDEALLHKFVESKAAIESSDMLISLLTTDAQKWVQELIDFKVYVDPSKIQSIVNDVAEHPEELDIFDIPLDLQKFLKEIVVNERYSPEAIKSWSMFARRLQKNIDPYIRHQLFNFLNFLIDEGSLAITEDGSFLGYKGIDNNWESIHSGNASVDGVQYQNAKIPNFPNTVISMPRTSVEADPNSGCSYGLHVGSYQYATSFGRKLILVEVAPEDVVSIPTDCHFQKLRCCKYSVIGEAYSMLEKKIYSRDEINSILSPGQESPELLVNLDESEISELLDKEFKEDSNKDNEENLTSLSKEEVQELLSVKLENFTEKLTDLDQETINSLLS